MAQTRSLDRFSKGLLSERLLSEFGESFRPFRGRSARKHGVLPTAAAGSGKLAVDRGDRACDRSRGELRMAMITAVSAVIS
jgi:hypothetical protein